MNAETASRLLDLNRRFYQTFANQFSITRQRLQPGVKQVLETLDLSAHVLDLGCGNGELAVEFANKGFRGRYVGVDSSANLLAEARQKIPESINSRLLHADLASPDWYEALQAEQFDVILAFAVLHHLPGDSLRRQVLYNVRAHADPKGRFVHSEWQFLNSSRLRARIQPWGKVGLSDTEVDPGDYLLDWRRGGYGLRYVHHFTEEELQILAEESGFRVIETFYSDGKRGDLGLYQIWKPI